MNQILNIIVYHVTCNCCNKRIGYITDPHPFIPGAISSKKPSKRTINKLLKEHRQQTGCSQYKVVLVSNPF